MGEVVLFMTLYLRLVPVFNLRTFKETWYLTSPLWKRSVSELPGKQDVPLACVAWGQRASWTRPPESSM